MALGTTGLVMAAALTAAVAGAGVAALCLETARPAAPAAGGDADRYAALEARIARQEEEIQALQGRIEVAAAARHLPAPDRAGAAPPEPAVNSADGTDAPLAESPGHPAAVPPAELARFEDLYRAMREKEQEDQRRNRLAGAEAQFRDRLDRAQNLDLTAEQKEAVVRIVMGRTEKLRQVFESARAPGATPSQDSFRAMQEQATAVRAEAKQSLEALLTAEQMKIVDALDRGGANDGRFGGRPADANARRAGGGRRPAAGPTQEPPK